VSWTSREQAAKGGRGCETEERGSQIQDAIYCGLMDRSLSWAAVRQHLPTPKQEEEV
jgi:hypothetical protein